MVRGYPIRRWLSLAVALSIWAVCWSPALAESGSRYSAPLWTWITAIVVAIGLSLVGMALGFWFLRKRSRIESSD